MPVAPTTATLRLEEEVFMGIHFANAAGQWTSGLAT
jgi:hypothetical protein